MQQARKHPGAEESVTRLQREGMDTRVLIGFLYDYTHPDSISMTMQKRRSAREMMKRIPKVQQNLKDAAETLQAILPLMSEQTVFVSFHSAIHTMRDIALQLAPLCKEVKKVSSQRGKGRNDEILVFLCLDIQAITGRPHWGDLAYLLEVASELHGKPEDWDADKVRGIFKRFRSSYPKTFQATRNFLGSTGKT
jgi:hypothetical protein